MSLPELSPTVRTTPLRLGSDCSGMDAPAHALAELGVDTTHAFASDSCPVARAFLTANYPPVSLYMDITKRNHAQVPLVDLYVAGFPCQPFSAAGLRLADADPSRRDKVVEHVLRYVEVARPAPVVLENVVGFRSAGAWTSPRGGPRGLPCLA